MFPDLARDDVFRLETRRLWLRWPRQSDAPALSVLASEWDVARATAMIPHPYAPEDADRFILAARAANARGAALRFGMTLKSFPRKFVGMIGVELDETGPRIGFWLGRPYWGSGLMSEAVEATTDVFFRLTEGDELAAFVLPENAASRSVLEKAGFVEEGRIEAGPGRHADSPFARLVLRRRDWQGFAGLGLRPGLASARALS
ncbi:GNAT family N-acetyltransferase [Rhodoblastus sp.]|uniref:GNAT family N-acetyltransferase n=1 Tax=Rhodoblastus sp. TaxID=1962975 RepID=UPI0025D0EA2A|nr:GNAT family N-acetyltransferase [Rhodoblastus sp.]